MNIVWSPEALEDIGAAVDYLVGQHAAEAATKLVDRLTTLAERLARSLFSASIINDSYRSRASDRDVVRPHLPISLPYGATSAELLADSGVSCTRDNNSSSGGGFEYQSPPAAV